MTTSCCPHDVLGTRGRGVGFKKMRGKTARFRMTAETVIARFESPPGAKRPVSEGTFR
jgi:hypothetical protein